MGVQGMEHGREWVERWKLRGHRKRGEEVEFKWYAKLAQKSSSAELWQQYYFCG